MTAVEQRYVHQEKEWDVHLNHLLDDLQRAIEPYPSENGVSTNPYGVIQKTTENIRVRHPSKGYEYTEVTEPGKTTKYSSSSVVYKSDSSQNYTSKLPSRRDCSPDLRLNFDDDRVSTPLPTTRLRQNISELDDLLDGLNSARRQGFTTTTTRTRVIESQDGFRGEDAGPASHSTPNASRKYDREAIRQVNQQVSRELQYRERDISPSRYSSQRDRSFHDDKPGSETVTTTVKTYNTWSNPDDTLSSDHDIEREKEWYSQQPSRKSRQQVEVYKGPKKTRKTSPSPSRPVDSSRSYTTTSHTEYITDGYPPDRYPSDKYPSDKYPSEKYPVDRYPSDKYPADKYPADRYPADRYPADRYPSEKYPVDRYPEDKHPVDKYGSPPGEATTRTTRTYYYTSNDHPGDNYPPQGTNEAPGRPNGIPYEVSPQHPTSVRSPSPGYPHEYPGPHVTTTTKTYYTYNKKEPASPVPSRKYPERVPVDSYPETPQRPKQSPSPYDTDPNYPKGKHPSSQPGHPGYPGSPGTPGQPGTVTTVRTYNYSYNYPSQPVGKPGSFPVDPSMHPGPTPTGTDVPKRLDDLMASISDSEDFSPLPSATSTRVPLLNTSTKPHHPHDDPDVSLKSPSLEVSHKGAPKGDNKLSPTKNIAGPAVYYPPKYEDTFTMKREESKVTPRWMMEQQAYSASSRSGGKWKYSAMSKSKSSESSGGAVVPLCLPLCCAAPLCCTIM